MSWEHGIPKERWDDIKSNSPQLAEQLRRVWASLDAEAQLRANREAVIGQKPTEASNAMPTVAVAVAVWVAAFETLDAAEQLLTYQSLSNAFGVNSVGWPNIEAAWRRLRG